MLKKKGVKADKEKQHSEKKNVQQDSYKFWSFHDWLNKLLSEEIRVIEHGLKLERWQGLTNINKVKRYEIVYSIMKTKCWVCFGI